MSRLESLFDAIVDLSPPEAARVLDAECKDLPELRAAVERLVAHDRAVPAGFLEPAITVVEGHGAPAELRESARVARYRVLWKLGEGGMGDVFAAYDETLDRRVALKVLRGGHVSEDWLRREALALARLAHPNVVAVHEIGEHEGRAFVAMELVDGVTLRGWLEAKTRTTEEILRIFLACGRGLVAAHEAGIVHRDFKPVNVIVGADGRPRVLDFGIAALREAPEELVLGTPQYMSPEQFGAEGVGPASDQFSFCVALYRALFRTAPFAGDDILTLRKNVLAGALRAPPPADVPPWLTPILLRGLARHAAARYDTLAELLAAIESRLSPDPELDPSASRWGRRGLALVMLVCGTTILGGIHLHGGFTSVTTLPHLVLIAAVVLCFSSGGVLALRRKILANRFGSQIASVILVGTGSLLVHRLFAWHFGQPVPQVLAIDMLIVGLELLLATFVVQRELALGAFAMLGGAAAAAFLPGSAFLVIAAASMSCFAAVWLSWRRS